VCFTTFDNNNSGSGGKYQTALQAASAMGNLDVVALLLKHGADVTVQGEYLHVQTLMR